MKRRNVVVLALGVALLAATQVPASAGHSWNGYHIDDHDGNVEITVVDRLTSYQTQLSQAVGDWNASPSPLDLTVEAGTGNRPAACDNAATEQAGAEIAGTLQVCNAAYGNNGWLGLARIWLDASGHIDASVTLMNDSYLQSEPYNDPVAWRHVMCQELGHDFGLDHVSGRKARSCMNDRTGLFDPRYESPNGHDYDQLNSMYGGSTSGNGGGPGRGNDKSCRNPKKCSGGHGIHVVPRPNGGHVITFTFDA